MSRFLSHPVHKILSWAVIAVVAPSLTGLGVAFLALGDAGNQDYFLAKACFILVFFIFAAKIVQWGILRRPQTVMIPLFVFVGTGLMGLAAWAAGSYVNGKRDAKASRLATESAKREPIPIVSSPSITPTPAFASPMPSVSPKASIESPAVAKDKASQRAEELRGRKEKAFRALDLKDPE